MNSHVVQGQPDREEILRDASRTTGRVNWTVPKHAQPRDRVFFYLVGPVSAIVATGIITEPARLNRNKRDPWFDYYMAGIRRVEMLPEPVSLPVLRQALPEWKYLNKVQGMATVPVSLRTRLMECLKLSGRASDQAADLSDIEGIQTETRMLVRKRSEILRRAALDGAKGCCSVCDRDFSKVLNGEGTRVLQVHHRRQMASLDKPRVTKIEDLAVVCANCHLLIHLDPKRAIPVDRLRRMLAADVAC